jgi:glucose uptake protein
MDLENFSQPAAGKMTPYTAVFIFSVGIFVSNFLFNTYLMRRPFEGPPTDYNRLL